MEEANVITIEIFGREYKIKGFADEKYITKVARYVHEKMTELSRNLSLSSHDTLATLAALNIADELFCEKEKASETFSQIEQKADHLIGKLDNSLLTKE